MEKEADRYAYLKVLSMLYHTQSDNSFTSYLRYLRSTGIYLYYSPLLLYVMMDKDIFFWMAIRFIIVI
jgi:hypothetical protein